MFYRIYRNFESRMMKWKKWWIKLCGWSGCCCGGISMWRMPLHKPHHGKFHCGNLHRMLALVDGFTVCMLLSFPLGFQCFRCVESISGVSGNIENGEPCQRHHLWVVRVPQHWRAILLLQLANNGISLGETAGIHWLARWAFCSRAQ